MPLNFLTRPRRIHRTGDDSPASGVWGYVLRMTGRGQLVAVILAVCATGLALAPIELQRRMIDDALPDRNVHLLLLLGVIIAFAGGFSRLGDPFRQLIGFYRETAEAEVRHDLLAKWMSG